MTPVDLTRYADRFKLGRDETAAIPGQSQSDRAWLRLIPCKFGKIFPWSETHLAAYVIGHKKAREFERLPFVTVAQGGGPGCGEVIVRFAPEHLEEMARVIGAKRRKRLSAAHRAKLVTAGTTHRFPGRAGQVSSSRSKERVS